MSYIYGDEDNVPMNEEAWQHEKDGDDRHCDICKNHDGKYCQVWDCKFEPRLQNCRDRCRYSKICEKQYHCKGSTDPSYPFECAIYAKIDDLCMEEIPFFDPDDPCEEEYDDNENS